LNVRRIAEWVDRDAQRSEHVCRGFDVSGAQHVLDPRSAGTESGDDQGAVRD
jgi:hypothetical protein